MAANKPGVMIYFETLQAIDALSPEDTKQIIGAILRYARDGESPSLHGALAALWFFIKPSLDRDGARYDEMRTRGLWLTYCRKCKKEGIEPLPLEEWAAQQTVDSMLSCCEQPVERRVNIGPPSTTTLSSSPSTPSPSPSPSPSSASIESKEGGGEEKPPASDWAELPPKQSGAAAPTPSGSGTKKRFGAYGWVRLTDDEYARLLDELGEAELQRCIAYIDESAQSSGNKNKWKDWNLVIRRCSRDHWGIRNGDGNGERRGFGRNAMDELQQLHQMYESWEVEQNG